MTDSVIITVISQNTRLCSYATSTTNQLTYVSSSERRLKEEVSHGSDKSNLSG